MNILSRAKGFTLVELLVVVTIIGILMGLLLPAVQGVREAARQMQCSNNLKQLALGCLEHESKQGFLPTGGWTWVWAGDPDRGFTKRQPGGWLFNVLPYIEQASVHDLGINGNTANIRRMVMTPVTVFICPSRRIPAATTGGFACYNINSASAWDPPVGGKTDYVACSGDCGDTYTGALGPSGTPGATLYNQADGWTEDWWYQNVGGGNATGDAGHPPANGVIYRRSMTTIANIFDGASTTYLLGEKSLDPRFYQVTGSWGDDQGWCIGYDYDNIRWTNNDPTFQPGQDQYGQDNFYRFGSAHPQHFGMAMCDGSVCWLNYSINATVHFYLGNRKDGQTIDDAMW